MPAIGLALKNFVGPAETPDIDALYTYAARAEALGFESLWAWDHVILGVEPAFPILDAVGTLTAIAARTKRIRLGTGILVLPLRSPTVAAKALGTLDVVSKGRLILGVAAGWYAREFDAVGVPFKERGRLFERNLEVLRSRAETEAPMRQWLQTEWDVAAWSESTIEHAIRGSVDECVAQLRPHLDSGVHRIILIPYRYQPQQVEIIAKEVMPRLR